MTILDVFSTDPFTTVSLTASINKMPYQPSRLGSMGLFRKRGIPSTTAVVEEKQGRLQLLKSQARGTMPQVTSGPQRKARSFTIPHVPLNADVMADDVQGVRQFGSENAVEGVVQVVNDKLENMRQSHEYTHEYHRAGAIQGNVLDGDTTTTLYNWFTEFTITETEVEFDFTDSSLDVKLKALEVVRAIEDALGAAPYTRVHCMCGDTFFDDLISHASVKDAFARWQDGAFLREDQRKGFPFASVTWENYRGKVGTTPFIADEVARFFPIGVPGLFDEIYGPADFVEAVNTVGKATYAKQERIAFDKGIMLHTQSNPLIMCTRPACLIKGVYPGSTSGSG